MTGDESRKLKVGDRVCWGSTTNDLGTVAKTTWSEVTINWDDGHTASIQHNDMTQVERVPNFFESRINPVKWFPNRFNGC